MNRLQEIEQRLAAIKTEIDAEGADLDKLETEINELKTERQAILDKIEKRKNLLSDIANLPHPDILRRFDKENEPMTTTDEILNSKEYRTAFLKGLQGKELTDVEKRYTASGVSGVIPVLTANKIFDHMTKIAPMLSEIELLQVAGNLRFAAKGTRNAAAVHEENAAATPAADTLVNVTLGGKEFVKAIRISAAVSSMAVDAFESWLVKSLGEDIAAAIDKEIVTADTVTGGVAKAQTWGVSNSVTYTDNVSYEDLTNLISLLPAAFDGNAKFLMNKAMFYQQVMQIKDAADRLIAIQDLTAPSSFRILGYPVLIDDNVAANEAYFGDFKQVVGNLSSPIKVDRSAESGFLNNSVDFRGVAVFDCAVAQPKAIVKLSV